MKIYIVDTCSSDYLLNHHNREGEMLIGLPCSEGWGNAFEKCLVEYENDELGQPALSDIDKENLLHTLRRNGAHFECEPTEDVYTWVLFQWEVK